MPLNPGDEEDIGSLYNELVEGRSRIGVWGCGYIGLTSMAYFANRGIYVIGTDVNPLTVQNINSGNVSIPNLERWLGFEIRPLVKEGLIRATEHWRDLLAEDVRVHLIAVPTEIGGEPWDDPITDVASKQGKRTPTAKKPDLIIVESTLTPGTLDNVVIRTLEQSNRKVGVEYLVGLAPRRDWFESSDKNLKNLKRVIGGTTPRTTEVMKKVLGLVCDNLIEASDHRVVEIVKSVENSILHVCSVYAMQLSRAYPHVDVYEVLRLSSTHWRIPLYYPSMGTGGYCVPVSTKYVKRGAVSPENLGIADETIKYDTNQPLFVADLIARKSGGPIGVLGLAYKGDLKVHTLSPTIRMVDRLRNLGKDVRVHDPYYTKEEIFSVLGTDTFLYPDDLKVFSGIIIVPNHRLYERTPRRILCENLRRGQTILDNLGTWERWRTDFLEMGIDYHRVGDRNWCTVPASSVDA